MVSYIPNMPDRIGPEGDNNCVIVFVHGLGGGRETWLELATFLNSNWIENFSFDLKFYHTYNEKSLLNKFFIFLKNKIPVIGPRLLFLYRVFVGESISVLAKGLSSYIEVNCHQYDRIILVGHSMGGLIARKTVVNELESRHSSEVDKLLTYASPHKGSHYAQWLGFTLQIRQMNYFKSKFLDDLNKLWYELSAKSHVNPTYIVATKDKIVNHKSAMGTDEDPHIVYAVGQSHSSLIKPNNIDDIGYATLVKIIYETFVMSQVSKEGALDEYEAFLDDETELEGIDDEIHVPGQE